MKYKVILSNSFSKDLERVIKQGRNISELDKVVLLLQSGGKLPERYKDYPLKGKPKGVRKPHIQPDWLPMYIPNKKEGQTKSEFLRGIIEHGSMKAKTLKCADRISNMISTGFVTDPAFIERYCDETEFFIFPLALEVDFRMYQELIELVMTRRKYLEDSDYLDRKKEAMVGLHHR